MKPSKKSVGLTGKLFWFSIFSIFYTYFGYPALVWLLARLRPKPEPYNEYTPRTTLLVAAYNEDAVIEQKLKNCLELDYPAEQLQILVVNDGSDDRTAEIVQLFADANQVDFVNIPARGGKMAAINQAMRFAEGEIVVFSDANCFYHPQTLKEMVKPFQDPQVGVVSGVKTILEGDGNLGDTEGLYWKYESFIKEHESRLGCCTGVTGEVLTLRKSSYQPPPDHVINDDFYMAMKIVKQGYNCIFVPTAKSYERVSKSAQDEIRRRQRINAGRFQAVAMSGELLPTDRPLVMWQIISHKYLRLFLPFAMMGAFFANLLAVLLPLKDSPARGKLWRLEKPYNYILFICQTLFYGLAWLGGRTEKQEQQSKLSKLLYVPTYLVNGNLAALKGFFRYMRGQQTTLWERIPRR